MNSRRELMLIPTSAQDELINARAQNGYTLLHSVIEIVDEYGPMISQNVARVSYLEH